MKQPFHLIEEFEGRILSCRLLVKADNMDAAIKKLRRMRRRQVKKVGEVTTYRPATVQETERVINAVNVGGMTMRERLNAKLKRK